MTEELSDMKNAELSDCLLGYVEGLMTVYEASNSLSKEEIEAYKECVLMMVECAERLAA